jgi:flagellar protein FlbD
MAGLLPSMFKQEPNMIQLTRLNNHPLVVNSDLIKFVEQAPDTVITLVSGDKIVVRESAQGVLERVIEFRRSVLQGTVLWSENTSTLLPVLEGSNSIQSARSMGIAESIAPGAADD